jgi:hypothetical protein
MGHNLFGELRDARWEIDKDVVHVDVEDLIVHTHCHDEMT